MKANSSKFQLYGISEQLLPMGKNYDTRYYNLDVIISVGYRVKPVSCRKFELCVYNL